MTALAQRPTRLDPLEIRSAMAAVPTSVCVVSGDGTTERAAIVVGSFVSISLEPAIVGFFVGLESSTWPTLKQNNRIGISVLGSEHTEFIREITKKDPERFAAEKWLEGPNGEQLVNGAVTCMTGTIESTLRIGDHDFITVSLESISSCEDPNPLIFQSRQIQPVKA